MTKEEVYDAEVYPLMDKIVAICKEHKIAMPADFALDEDLRCTTALLDDEYFPGKEQLEAFQCVKPKRNSAFAMAITTATKTDGSQHITMKRIS